MSKKIILRIFLVGLIIILGLICGWLGTSQIARLIGQRQNNTPAEVTIDSPTITFIGDSITNGYYSTGELQSENYGYRQIVTEQTNATAYNFAVGGYTSVEVLDQLNSNFSLNQTNQIILEKNSDNPQLATAYPQVQTDITISEAIAASDYVISTMGANDVMQELLEYNDDGSFRIKKQGFKQGLDNIYQRKYQIYQQIHAINPNAKIIDVGMYMAYPHISNFFTAAIYPVLIYTEHTIFIEDEELNLSKVTIRDNLQADIKNYVDNPNDIHPNQAGHQVIANEVLKEMEND